jgi:hypothetical protein
MTNTQKLETSREIRLWVTRIIIPTVILFRVSPGARTFVSEKYRDVKDWVTSRIDYHKASKGYVKE